MNRITICQKQLNQISCFYIYDGEEEKPVVAFAVSLVSDVGAEVTKRWIGGECVLYSSQQPTLQH